MQGTFFGGFKAQFFSAARGFTFASLDQMESHFKNSQPYQDGFRHLLAVAWEFILDNLQQLGDDPGKFADIRDGYINTILAQIDEKDPAIVNFIPDGYVEAFKVEFRPVLMALCNFHRQENDLENKRPIEVQGAHGDSTKYYIHFAPKSIGVKGNDIALFKKGNDSTLEYIATLEFITQGQDVAPVVEGEVRKEVTTITESIAQPEVPLSVIYQQSYPANMVITQQSVAATSAVQPEQYSAPAPPSAPLSDNYLYQPHLNQVPYQPLQNSGLHQSTLGAGDYYAESRHTSGYQPQFNQSAAPIYQPPVATNYSAVKQGSTVYSNPNQQQLNWGNLPPQNYPPYAPTVSQPQGWNTQSAYTTNYARNHPTNYSTNTTGFASHGQGQTNYATMTSPYSLPNVYSGQSQVVAPPAGYENNPFASAVSATGINPSYTNNSFERVGNQGPVASNPYATNYYGQPAYPPSYPPSYPSTYPPPLQ